MRRKYDKNKYCKGTYCVLERVEVADNVVNLVYALLRKIFLITLGVCRKNA